MAIIKELKGDMPKIGERAFLAETATIIGTVEMGDDCSVWYGAVLRGDVGAIRIGDRQRSAACDLSEIRMHHRQ